MSDTMRTYSELITLPTFMERFDYLSLGGTVGINTFEFDRYLNQDFYKSTLWKQTRNKVIARDYGFDLGCLDRQICGKIMIHHMNPITKQDILDGNPAILDPEFLISCSYETHNAIHYGNRDSLITDYSERTPNDTCPWL